MSDVTYTAKARAREDVAAYAAEAFHPTLQPYPMKTSKRSYLEKGIGAKGKADIPAVPPAKGRVDGETRSDPTASPSSATAARAPTT